MKGWGYLTEEGDWIELDWLIVWVETTGKQAFFSTGDLAFIK